MIKNYTASWVKKVFEEALKLKRSMLSTVYKKEKKQYKILKTEQFLVDELISTKEVKAFKK